MLVCIAALPVYSFKLYSVADAAKSRLIQIKVKSTGGHTGQCLEMSLSNPKPYTVNVLVEAGRLFASSNATKQDIIAVKHEIIEIPPKGKATRKLYGLCAEKSDGSPDAEDTYSVGRMARNDAKGLAKLIDEKGYFHSNNIQQAMWALTDNAPITFAATTGVEKDLLSYIAEVKNTTVAALMNLPAGMARSNAPGRYNFISTYNFNLSDSRTVSILLFDGNSNLVKEFMRNERLAAGTHSRRIELSSATVSAGNYILRVFVNGEMKEERRLKVFN
jgi:hypothetical protein